MTDNIKELVERFQNRIDDFCSNQYKEVHLRQEFIDRFFDALGWDMYGEQVTSFLNREVILEDKVKIEGKSKAPDYGFYINAKRQFFLEAKRASLDIFSEKESAFQLRRYGWSASLPISILTNFRLLAIYDCRIKPEREDFASKARIAKFSFEEYVERWDEIYSLLSRNAVQNGSLITLLEEGKLKSFESQPVDEAFLAEIEDWRMALARNISERNDLDIRDLNFAVQAIINRLIFLRLCEDKGIEPYGRLLEMAKSKQIYKKLSQFFKQADKRYNAGLFHFYKERGRTTAPDKWTLSLQIDDKNLRRIIQSIYPPNTPYEFSVIPIEILGHVYEQFLGKVIVLDKKQQAKVENKPEVKKAGGVYYTPEYIVNYIVENTVGKLLENKTPDEVSKLSILDPACGSGSFLIGAYTYLLDWHLNYYSERPEEYKNVIFKITENTYQLTSPEKKRILLNNIYGVDIDQQAVEISKLSLLLKVLEGETQKSIDYQLELYKERALPDLDKNIKCGNSLISNDFYNNEPNEPENEELRYRVNAFDWEEEFAEIMGSGGFDVVIGNPPYVLVGSDKLIEQVYYLNHFKMTAYKTNTYLLFLEKGLNLLGSLGSILAFIIPKSLVFNTYFSSARSLLMSEFAIPCIVEIEEKVFQLAEVGNSLLFFSQICSHPKKNRLKYFKVKNVYPHFKIINQYENLQEELLQSQDVLFYRTQITFQIKTSPLSQIALVSNGLNPGNIRHILFSKSKESDKHQKMVLGRDIQRYHLSWSGTWINYDLELKNQLTIKDTQSKNGMIAQKKVDFALRSPDIFKPNKIIVRKTADKILACFDFEGYYLDSLAYSIQLLPNTKESIYYLLGLLTSKLIGFTHDGFSMNKNKAFAKVLAANLKKLPIRTINFDNPSSIAQHDKMVKLVEQMLILHQQLNEATSNSKKETIQRQINRTDKSIDQLVYELYDLTPDDIAIVEEGL